jgi:hypothetical protein
VTVVSAPRPAAIGDLTVEACDRELEHLRRQLRAHPEKLERLAIVASIDRWLDWRLDLAPAAVEPSACDDPVGYCRDVLRFEPWSKQIEVLEAVRDHRRVAVRSCHGVGKTAIAAARCSGSTTRTAPTAA